MSTVGANQRLFSSFYSPLAQRALVENDASVDDYVAQLRFDSLLARQLVIPDTYLFDGRLFLELAPEDFFERLGLTNRSHDGSVEIASRAQSLEHSLALLLEAPEPGSNATRLSPFPFNFLSDAGARDRLATELKSAGPTGLEELRLAIRRRGAAAGVAQFLRDRLRGIGEHEAASECDIAERAWQAWIKCVDAGRVKMRRYDGSSFVTGLRRQMEFEPACASPGSMAADLVDEVQRSAFRADVAKLIRATLATAPVHERSELVYLESWYTRIRHRALAAQHQCTLARTELPEQAPRIGPLQSAVADAEENRNPEGTPVVTIPPYFLRGLRGMAGQRFAEVKLAGQKDLARWWTRQDVNGFRTVIDLLDDAFGVASTAAERRERIVSVLATVGAVTTTATIAAVKTSQGFSFGQIPVSVLAAIISGSASIGWHLSKPARMRRQVVEYGLWRMSDESSIK